MQNEERGVMPPPLPQASSASSMYHPALENLVKAALADGVLTEKEKQVLFKRAQALGVDLDEFEMVLEARLYEHQQARMRTNVNATAAQPLQSGPKSTKCGEVRKCPACGAMIGTFLMACPDCGHEFVGVGANSFVESFAKGLRKAIANATKPKGFMFNRSQGGLMGTLQGMMDLHQQAIEQAGTVKNENAVKAEAEYVKAAVLPRAKEDCIEMLNFITPKIKVSGANYATKEWRKYYVAVLDKLEMGGGNDQELASLVAYHRKQLQVSAGGNFLLWWNGLSQMAKIGVGLVAFYFVLFIITGVAIAFT
ncbi:MAG: hypothetical protein IKZ20_04615 [Bacteroidaceae bacterium]|nr:hypothetical protein [Bacteroidaceae bacterium]